MIKTILDWLTRPAKLPVVEGVTQGVRIDLWTRPTDDGAMIDLPDDQLYFINKTMTCPYCKSKLFGGPRGGASLNLFCENVNNCDSRFNVVDPEWGFVPMGQFTGQTPPDFKNFIRESSHGGD